jgi:creatinine amidohydrolase
MPYWQELTHKQFIKACHETEVALMVVGALEAHGDHLPLGSDTILPSYLADIVAKRTKALVLPPIPFGESWVFEEFEGTLCVSPSALLSYYSDVMESIFRHGFRYIVALNGHGGNSSLLQLAARKSTISGERAVVVVNWWTDLGKEIRQKLLESPEGHAAEDETSEMMSVRPDLVDTSSFKRSNVQTKYAIVSGRYRAELFPSAIRGDPTKATREKGNRFMEEAARELLELIAQLEKGELPLMKK